MKRNLFKYAERGVNRAARDQRLGLSLDEVEALLKRHTERTRETDELSSLLELIVLCHGIGLEEGARLQAKKQRKHAKE